MGYTRRATAYASSANNVNVSPPVPTHEEDDLLVLYGGTNNGAGVLSITEGGWTQLQQNSPAGTDIGQAMFYRVATDSEPETYTLHSTMWQDLHGRITSYDPNGGTLDTENIQSTVVTLGYGETNTTMTTDSITANAGDLFCAGWIAGAVSPGIDTPPSGCSIIGAALDTGMVTVVYDLAAVSAGAITKSLTWDAEVQTCCIAATFGTTGGAPSPVTVSPAAASITVSADAPAAALGPWAATPDAAAVTVSTDAPAAGLGSWAATPAAASVGLSADAPTLAFGPWSTTPASASVVVAGQAPTVVAGANVTVSPAAAAITLASESPVPALGPWSAVPAAASVSVAGVVPAIGNTVQLETIHLEAHVAVGAGINFAIQPAAASISVAGQDVLLEETIPVAAASVTVSTSAPSVESGANVTIEPLNAEVLVAGKIPTVNATGGVNAEPDAASVTVTGQDVTPDEWSGFAGSPSAAAVTVTGQTPTIGFGPWSIVPAAADIAVEGQAPALDIGQDVTIQPLWGMVLVAGAAPVVDITTGKTLQPACATILVSGCVPAIVAEAVLTAVPNFTVGLSSLNKTMTLRPYDKELTVG